MKDKKTVKDTLQAWETMRKTLPGRTPTCFCSACVEFYMASMTCHLCLGLRRPKSKQTGHREEQGIFIFCKEPHRPHRLVLGQVVPPDGRGNCISADQRHGAESCSSAEARRRVPILEEEARRCGATSRVQHPFGAGASCSLAEKIQAWIYQPCI